MGGLLSLAALAVALGEPLVATGRRKPAVVGGLAAQIVVLAVLIYVPGLPVAALGGLCFLVGFLGSSQIVCFALARENHARQLSGTAIGFVNMMVTGAGALFQPLVGFLLDLAWAGDTALGARVYDTGAYRLALTSLVVACLAGLLCLAPVRETYCRSQA